MCIIAVLLSISSTSPIIDSIQLRRHLTGNTGDVLELEAPSSAMATAATQVLLERVQGYENACWFTLEVSSLGMILTDVLLTAKCIRGTQ